MISLVRSFLLLFCLSLIPVSLVPAQSAFDDLISDFPEPAPDDPIDLDTKNRAEVRQLLRFIYFSRVAYLSSSDEEAILSEFPGAIIKVTEKTNTRFFLHKSKEKKRVMISIRGSANLKNWLLNLEFWMRENDWFEHEVHAGFYRIAEEIYNLISSELESDYEIILTGHSMGGAVATLIGSYLQGQGQKVEVVTFAQPRVTNNFGAIQMGSLNLTRVVIEGDVVNMLPPFDYAHFGKEMLLQVDRYYPKDLEFQFDPDREPKIYLPLVKFKFGGAPGSASSTRRSTNPTGSKTFYNSYIEGGKLDAVHSLNAYFKALRSRVSDILDGVDYPLNDKLDSIQFPQRPDNFPSLPFR